MPPKAKAGRRTAEDDEVAGNTNTAQDRLVAGLEKFLATEKLPLSEEEYEALIPRHAEGPYWTAEDEDALQADGRFADILRRGKQIWLDNDAARQLWRLFPRVYRCLPTELFSWTYQLEADTGDNPLVKEGRHAGAPNVVWSKRFCREVTAFTMHGFWTYEREWDLPVMAQLMQLAVICRRNDCRPWRFTNHTDDLFLAEMASELRKPGNGVPTIKDIVGAVEARMDARNKRPRPTEFRLLFHDIVEQLFKPTAGPLVAGASGPYKVRLGDLQGLVRCLDRLAPSPGRTGLTTGWTAEEWKSIMETARGHSGKNQKLGPPPTKENDLLARAIAFGLMASERDGKIAERMEQDPFAARDEYQPFAERPEISGDDSVMVDRGEMEGLDAPTSPDNGVEQPPVESQVHPSVEEPPFEDKLDENSLDAQIKESKAFRKKVSQRPNRGRVDRDPIEREPSHDWPVLDELSEPSASQSGSQSGMGIREESDSSDAGSLQGSNDIL